MSLLTKNDRKAALSRRDPIWFNFVQIKVNVERYVQTEDIMMNYRISENAEIQYSFWRFTIQMS